MYVKNAPKLHNTFFRIGDYEFKKFQGECLTFFGENISVKKPDDCQAKSQNALWP